MIQATPPTSVSSIVVGKLVDMGNGELGQLDETLHRILVALGGGRRCRKRLDHAHAG